MAHSGGSTRIKSDVLALVRSIAHGRVATFDAIAVHLNLVPHHVAALIGALSEDEREGVPWHRVVAKGGAIGRGPMRDAQFARLVREGVPVSPAGIVQDMTRVAVAQLAAPPASVTKGLVSGTAPGGASGANDAASGIARGRSRGMRGRPGGSGAV